MTLKIGAAEIYYNYNYKTKEIPRFIKEDSEESVAQYQSWVHLQNRGIEVSNGMYMDCNILMLAVWYTNVSLVKFIVAHTDKKILNVRDGCGMTALFNATLSRAGPIEKVEACMRLLIEAGADMNLREGYITHLSSVDVELKDSDFPGNNALGNLVVTVAGDRYSTKQDKKRDLTLMQLLIEQGATCKFSPNMLAGDRKTCDQYWQRPEKRLCGIRKDYVFWQQRSPDSPIANVPQDVPI